MTTDSPDQPVADDEMAHVTAQVKGLLQTHVPISLLMDLTSPAGPPSKEILAAEGCPDAWWVTPAPRLLPDRP